MKEGYVLFFDSGVGGLTLLRECAARFPQERFAYIGDNANAPYGEKGEGESVWLTMFYIMTAKAVLPLCRQRGRERGVAALAEQQARLFAA